MYKSGICDTKQAISLTSETKRSRAKLTREYLEKLVYDLSIGDKSGDSVNFTLTYFSGEQNVSTTDISHTFCRSVTKFGSVRGLANRNLFPEFRGGLMISCGDMHQSFTDTHVKWLFRQLPHVYR